MAYLLKLSGFFILILLPEMGFASSGGDSQYLGLITAPLSLLALAIFVIAYALVMSEEFIHLRKSKPAVLTMGPEMNLYQWLLITLTTGVGGSILSIGSAAGVALMGQARGVSTFFSHLRWSWAILLGCFAAIYTHYLIHGPV